MHISTNSLQLACVLWLSTITACETSGQEQIVFAAPLAASKLVDSQREGQLASFRCEDCHDKIPTGTEAASGKSRKHREIQVDHFDGAEACFNCHDEQNRDGLRLLSGDTVSLNDSHFLCGQCHSMTLRDWQIGAHGKNVGGWAGVKNRLTCADCHDAHAPTRPTVQALPPPPFPRLGIPKGGH